MKLIFTIFMMLMCFALAIISGVNNHTTLKDVAWFLFYIALASAWCVDLIFYLPECMKKIEEYNQKKQK